MQNPSSTSFMRPQSPSKRSYGFPYDHHAMESTMNKLFNTTDLTPLKLVSMSPRPSHINPMNSLKPKNLYEPASQQQNHSDGSKFFSPTSRQNASMINDGAPVSISRPKLSTPLDQYVSLSMFSPMPNHISASVLQTIESSSNLSSGQSKGPSSSTIPSPSFNSTVIVRPKPQHGVALLESSMMNSPIRKSPLFNPILKPENDSPFSKRLPTNITPGDIYGINYPTTQNSQTKPASFNSIFNDSFSNNDHIDQIYSKPVIECTQTNNGFNDHESPLVPNMTNLAGSFEEESSNTITSKYVIASPTANPDDNHKKDESEILVRNINLTPVRNEEKYQEEKQSDSLVNELENSKRNRLDSLDFDENEDLTKTPFRRKNRFRESLGLMESQLALDNTKEIERNDLSTRSPSNGSVLDISTLMTPKKKREDDVIAVEQLFEKEKSPCPPLLPNKELMEQTQYSTRADDNESSAELILINKTTPDPIQTPSVVSHNLSTTIDTAPHSISPIKPHVCLSHWKIQRVPNDPELTRYSTTDCPLWIILEGHKKISEESTQLWHSSLIVGRHGPRDLVTSTGKIYHLEGEPDVSGMLDSGLSSELIEKLEDGFPTDWISILTPYLQIERKRLPKSTKLSNTTSNSTTSSTNTLDKQNNSVTDLLNNTRGEIAKNGAIYSNTITRRRSKSSTLTSSTIDETNGKEKLNQKRPLINSYEEASKENDYSQINAQNSIVRNNGLKDDDVKLQPEKRSKIVTPRQTENLNDESTNYLSGRNLLGKKDRSSVDDSRSISFLSDSPKTSSIISHNHDKKSEGLQRIRRSQTRSSLTSLDFESSLQSPTCVVGDMESLPKSRSGRKIVPPTAYWLNEYKVNTKDGSVKIIRAGQSGGLFAAILNKTEGTTNA